MSDKHERIVTARSVAEVFDRPEANESIQDALQKTLHDQVQQAQLWAMIGEARREIDKAQKNVEPDVLAAPQDEVGSLLQSFLASGEKAEVQWIPLAQGLELKFERIPDWYGWALSLLDHVDRKNAHHIVRPKVGQRAYPFPDAGRIALLGDWGTGLYGAPICAQSITNDPEPYAMIMHLGDTYYSGTPEEMRDRFKKFWPKRKAIHRAINSNHDMYSGGFAYFDDIIAKSPFDQYSSYFVHENHWWTLIGLDTAYIDHDIDEEQAKWLRATINAAGDRKIILFSHQQLFSQWESQGTNFLVSFGDVIESGRIFAWYWGHEHRCCLYDEHPDYDFLARCVGHSGMPENRRAAAKYPVEIHVGDAQWRRIPARKGVEDLDGKSVPSCLVLDGRNPYMKGKEEKLAPHGYAVLNLNKSELLETICDPTGQPLWQKKIA
jgi:hypothetical protein